MNNWARKSAHKLHTRGRHKVYVGREENAVSPLAFMSLSLTTQQPSKLLLQEDRDAWHFGAPFLYLDYLGVLMSQQGRNIGTLMLLHAMQKTFEIHCVAPVYGLALRSISAKTTAYYEKLGFRMAPDEDRSRAPLMILPIFSIADLYKS